MAESCEHGYLDSIEITGFLDQLTNRKYEINETTMVLSE
jgi:predicted hydrocarbon binding protein